MIVAEARVAELTDALDLGSSGEIPAGSTPAPRTSAALEDGPGYGVALGSPASARWAGAGVSLTRHATNSETTHSAIPESVNVGR